MLTRGARLAFSKGGCSNFAHERETIMADQRRKTWQTGLIIGLVLLIIGLFISGYVVWYVALIVLLLALGGGALLRSTLGPPGQ